jgi:hypothetical protein
MRENHRQEIKKNYGGENDQRLSSTNYYKRGGRGNEHMYCRK